MIQFKEYAEYVTSDSNSINLRNNVIQKLFNQYVVQMKFTILKLVVVKKEELLQCVHHQLHIGILLILDAVNVHLQFHGLIRGLINVRLVHFITNGQILIKNVFNIVPLERNGIIIIKNV